MSRLLRTRRLEMIESTRDLHGIYIYIDARPAAGARGVIGVHSVKY